MRSTGGAHARTELNTNVVLTLDRTASHSAAARRGAILTTDAGARGIRRRGAGDTVVAAFSLACAAAATIRPQWHSPTAQRAWSSGSSERQQSVVTTSSGRRVAARRRTAAAGAARVKAAGAR
jgi:hypothetical protein